MRWCDAALRLLFLASLMVVAVLQHSAVVRADDGRGPLPKHKLSQDLRIITDAVRFLEDKRAQGRGERQIEVGADAMLIDGRAGYTVSVDSAEDPFGSVFVGAWGSAPRGRFCVQTLSASDGRFRLRIPRDCFRVHELVHLTAGGLTTCVAVPFEPGTRQRVQLVGRRSDDCSQHGAPTPQDMEQDPTPGPELDPDSSSDREPVPDPEIVDPIDPDGR